MTTEKCQKRVTTYCCVPQCNNYKKKGLSFHHFPADKELQKNWEAILQMGKPSSRSMRVCSEHFQDSDYFPVLETAKIRRLKKNVLPSQKLPVEKYDKRLTDQRAKISAWSNRALKIGTLPVVARHMAELNNDVKIQENCREESYLDQLENYKKLSTEPRLRDFVHGNYSMLRTQLIAPGNLGPTGIISRQKKCDAGRSSLKLVNISTQESSETPYNNKISDSVFIKEENMNIKIENECDENEYEVSFGNEYRNVLDTVNMGDNNVTVNVKVENEYDDQFATTEEEYPYELPVSNLEIQIKEEPFEKDEVI